MKISWYGNSCFLLEGQKAKVLLDPTPNTKGTEVDFVTLSKDSMNSDHELTFDWPGEYETKGVGVKGINIKNSKDENLTAFILETGKMRICHLGSLDRALTNEEISSFGDVDVLFLPVGGKTVIDAKVAHKIADEIDARMVIPMCFDSEGGATDFGPIDEFKREMGIKEDTEVKDFIKISSLPTDESQIFILNIAK
jgi:L-ascorbate metabolism protein UlaG (beta-lactamase superfamily)